MNPTMHIAAVGARTPIGLTAESSAAAMRAGICRFQEHPFLLTADGEPLVGAFDARIDSGLHGWRRFASLASSAIIEVLEKLARASGLQRDYSLPIPVLMSLPETRPGFSEDDAQQVIQELSRIAVPKGMKLKLEIAGRGHAGAMLCLDVASKRLDRERNEIFLICGVDSYSDADSINWLEENGQVLRKGIRSGFKPGEAAGAILVANYGLMKAIGMPSLGVVRGIGIAKETKLIKTDADVLGEGLSKALAQAIADLRTPEEGIDAIYCDINGERYRTEEWGLAILRGNNMRALKTTAYELSTGCWGDVGAASGALWCVLAVQSWARQYARGPRVLIWGGSEGGLRSAVVLEKRDYQEAAWPA